MNAVRDRKGSLGSLESRTGPPADDLSGRSKRPGSLRRENKNTKFQTGGEPEGIR